jgi:hypothetical protein
VSFAGDVARFQAKVSARAQDIHDGVCDLAFESIVQGHVVTGAPGQPVDTGHLKGSWQNIPLEPLTRLIVTNVVYAPAIEDGIGRYGPLTLRSAVGGFHSVKLTRAAWPRIVDTVAREVAGP